MKLYLFIIINLLFFTNKGFSQTASTVSTPDTTSPQARAFELTQSMTCELGLNAGQADKVNAINLEAYQRVNDAANAKGISARQLDRQENKIAKMRDDELKKTLTAKQWDRYERLANGQEHLLKVTKICRKPDQDAYGF